MKKGKRWGERKDLSRPESRAGESVKVAGEVKKGANGDRSSGGKMNLRGTVRVIEAVSKKKKELGTLPPSPLPSPDTLWWVRAREGLNFVNRLKMLLGSVV